MAQVIYAAFGPQPANPVNRTNQCAACKPTFDILGTDLVYDTEADARMTATSKVLRDALFQAIVPVIWRRQWNRFRCTNGQCRTRQACGKRPTHLAIGARTIPVPPPGGVLKWQIVIGMAREIRCVAGPAVPDETPEVPRVTVFDPPHFLASMPDTPLEVGELVAEAPAKTTKPRRKPAGKAKAEKKTKRSASKKSKRGKRS